MNLGQHVTDLIRLSAEIQKLSADGKDCFRIYKLALEAKESAHNIKTWATEKMGTSSVPEERKTAGLNHGAGRND